MSTKPTLSGSVGLLLILLFSSASGLQAQEDPNQPMDPAPIDRPAVPEIPAEYRSISLGMSPEEVKTRLSEDPWFDYRGEEDLSLLERPRASLIDAGGSLFINRGLFQFEENALAAIMLELNPETIDWFTLYTTLEQRYGAPTDMDPSRAWWDGETVRLALERPLTVKYLDLEVFDAVIADAADRKAWREQAREEFLGEF